MPGSFSGRFDQRLVLGRVAREIVPQDPVQFYDSEHTNLDSLL